MLYFGALVAFLAVWIIDSDVVVQFVDPIVLSALSLFLCILPVRICVANFKDLMMVAPIDLMRKSHKLCKI